MNSVFAQVKTLANNQLPPHENMLLVANRLGLKPDADLSNDEKIGRAITIGDRRFFGKGKSEEEALGKLFESILGAARTSAS